MNFQFILSQNEWESEEVLFYVIKIEIFWDSFYHLIINFYVDPL